MLLLLLLVSSDIISLYNNLPLGALVGDFALLQTLLAGAELHLLDLNLSSGSISSSGGISSLQLSIRNWICTDVHLEDLQIETDSTVFQNAAAATLHDVLAYTVTAAPFGMTCNGDYSYTQVLYNNSNGMSSMNSSLPTSSSSGSGSFQAVTENNSLSTRIDLHSASTFALEPPTFATLEYCTATTSVYQTFFQNDDIAVALDDNLTLLLSDLVSGRIASGTCLYLRVLSQQADVGEL